MMIVLHNPSDERFEARHYRLLADSASTLELARPLKELTETCERKAALLQQIEERTGRIPPVVKEP